MANVIFLQAALIDKVRYGEEWAYYYGGVSKICVLERRILDNGQVIDQLFSHQRFERAFPSIYPKWKAYMDAFYNCDEESRTLYEPTYRNRKVHLVEIMHDTNKDEKVRA